MAGTGANEPFHLNQNDMVLRGRNVAGNGAGNGSPPVPNHVATLPPMQVPESILQNDENRDPNSNNTSVNSILTNDSANEHYIRSLQDSGLKTSQAYVLSIVKTGVKTKLFKKMKAYKTPKSARSLKIKEQEINLLKKFVKKEIPDLELTSTLWDEIQKAATVTLRQRRCTAVEQVKRLFFGKN